MGKGLSQLQQFIIKEAHKKTIVSNADILIKWYGFEPVSFGSIKFDRQQIGMKKYLSASVAVARAFTRLRGRGLMIRNPSQEWLGNRLTEKGVEAIEKLCRQQAYNG